MNDYFLLGLSIFALLVSTFTIFLNIGTRRIIKRTEQIQQRLKRGPQ